MNQAGAFLPGAAHGRAGVTTPLKPMSLGEILDRTFQIYRHQFLVLVAIGALPSIVMLGIHLADAQWFHVHSLWQPPRQPGIFIWNFVIGLGFYHIASLVATTIVPGFVQQTVGAVLDEEESSLPTSLRFVLSRWRGYVWLSLLKLTSELVIPELLLIGLFIAMGYSMDAAGLLNENASWAFVVLGLLPAITGAVLFLWAGACFSLAIPACALEGLAGVKALRRSWVLSRNGRGRAVTTWLLVFTFGWILSAGLQFLLRWALIYLYWHVHLRMPTHSYESVFSLLHAGVSALIQPIYPVAITLIYYDQRIRNEGFDIEWMMKAAGLNAPAPAGPAAVSMAATESEERSA
jgi:hypothetical protein